METIKAYTDIEQSKKLVEILPIESADMYRIFENNAETRVYYGKMPTAYFVCKPCWSLAALMKIIEIDKSEICFDCYGEKYRVNVHYQTLGSFCQDNELYDSKIDALFAMIIKLHKRNLL